MSRDGKNGILVLFVFIIIIVGAFMFIKYRNRVEISDIKKLHFSYSTGTMMYANVSYDLELIEGKYIVKIKPNLIPEEETITANMKNEDIEAIKNILIKYNVQRWDGFNKSDKYVLDGNSFSFIVYFDNNNSVSASGYMMYPDNYKNVEKELDEILGGFYKMNVKININNKEYTLNLENNTTTKSFINLLPSEYTMKELNGNEKYIYLDNTLPIDPISPKHINKGDVMLYSNNCLVIFYKSFDTTYSYTKIGHIDNLEDLDNKDIKVKIFE